MPSNKNESSPKSSLNMPQKLRPKDSSSEDSDTTGITKRKRIRNVEPSIETTIEEQPLAGRKHQKTLPQNSFSAMNCMDGCVWHRLMLAPMRLNPSISSSDSTLKPAGSSSNVENDETASSGGVSSNRDDPSDLKAVADRHKEDGGQTYKHHADALTPLQKLELLTVSQIPVLNEKDIEILCSHGIGTPLKLLECCMAQSNLCPEVVSNICNRLINWLDAAPGRKKSAKSDTVKDKQPPRRKRATNLFPKDAPPWKNSDGIDTFSSEEVNKALWELAGHEWNGTPENKRWWKTKSWLKYGATHQKKKAYCTWFNITKCRYCISLRKEITTGATQIFIGTTPHNHERDFVKQKKTRQRPAPKRAYNKKQAELPQDAAKDRNINSSEKALDNRKRQRVSHDVSRLWYHHAPQAHKNRGGKRPRKSSHSDATTPIGKLRTMSLLYIPVLTEKDIALLCKHNIDTPLKLLKASMKAPDSLPGTVSMICNRLTKWLDRR